MRPEAEADTSQNLETKTETKAEAEATLNLEAIAPAQTENPLLNAVATILQRDQVDAGMLYIVGTPIGNLGDMTLRALVTLANVDVIYAEDTRNSGKLLRLFAISNKLVSYHEHNAQSRSDEVVEKLRQGQSAALITDAGMPAISDPGEILVDRCLREGLPVRVVPGPSAVISALAISGMPSHDFRFLGFLPLKGKEREEVLQSVRSYPGTTCIYEAPQRVMRTLEDFAEKGFGGRTLAVARELTKQYEEVVRGSVDSCLQHFRANEPKGEFVFLLGCATEQELVASESDAQAELDKKIRAALARGDSNKDILAELSGFANIPKNQLKRLIQEIRDVL